MPLKPKWIDRRTLAWAAAGLVAAGVIHISAVLALPFLAQNTAYARLRPNLPVNVMRVMPPLTPDAQAIPFLTPDARYAFCRFDLTSGSLLLRAPLPHGAWTIALYSRHGENFYTVSAAELKRTEITLQVSPPLGRFSTPINFQHSTPETAQRVVAPAHEGLAVIRAPIIGTSYAFETDGALARATCQIKPN